MSRKDYLFFNTLGQHYMELGQQFEQAKSFVCAYENYTVAGECYGKAEEIAKSDMMTDNGAMHNRKKYCFAKAGQMKEKSREAMSTASYKCSQK